MSRFFLFVTASYWMATLLRFVVRGKSNQNWERICSMLERASLALFTVGIVFYIGHFQGSDGQAQTRDYDQPISWLLFAWSLNVANIASELLYSNPFTAMFANGWTAFALTFLPHKKPSGFSLFFNNDAQWLSIHRICFLLGYALCLLAFPLAIRYFWASAATRPEDQRDEPKFLLLARIDRMSYRMILLALPLLTMGMVTEALFLLDQNQLPGLARIWGEHKEAVLAIATWVICGLYLHLRMFFAWRYRRAAFLYLGSFLVILAGHLGAIFF